jgi:hypothetical protein
MASTRASGAIMPRPWASIGVEQSAALQTATTLRRVAKVRIVVIFMAVLSGSAVLRGGLSPGRSLWLKTCHPAYLVSVKMQCSRAFHPVLALEMNPDWHLSTGKPTKTKENLKKPRFTN